jgi:hypothetical protein
MFKSFNATATRNPPGNSPETHRSAEKDGRNLSLHRGGMEKIIEADAPMSSTSAFVALFGICTGKSIATHTRPPVAFVMLRRAYNGKIRPRLWGNRSRTRT